MPREPAAAAATALGAIRLTNGLIALLAPSVLARRLGWSREGSSASYLLQMFGIRTIFLGLDLLTSSTDERQRALRRAPIIHVTDAVAATAATIAGQLPRRAGVVAAGISTINLALALAARSSRWRGG